MLDPNPNPNPHPHPQSLTLTLTLNLTYLKAAPFIYYGTYVAFFGKMVLVLAERGLPGANV